jgi:hypothetical protein
MKVETIEQMESIFENTDSKWKGDNAYQGLQILSKYTNNLIQGAGHDVIWAMDIDEAIKAGITKEDVTKLALLNWMIEDSSYFACFV